MAVQAQYLTHAFPHDLRAIRALDKAAGESVFLGDAGQLLGGGAAAQPVVALDAVFSDVPQSELTCNNKYDSYDGGFVPRKRARVAQERFMEDQRVLLPPVPQAACDVRSWVVESGAASTSGRPVNVASVSDGLLSHLYQQSVEIDALIRFENERLRAGLEEARQRHVLALVSAVELAAARRLREAEAELERERRRTAELEEKVRQMSAEGQAWLGEAQNHEAIATGLRATLDQLLQAPCAGHAAGESDAEDVQSCCFEAAPALDVADDVYLGRGKRTSPAIDVDAAVGH